MKTVRTKKSSAPASPTYPKVMEMFADPNITNYWRKPDCFNGLVHFRKYRVTVELVEEPQEVLHARLLKLWRESDNHHSWEPLQAAAKGVGLELKPSDFGKDRNL